MTPFFPMLPHPHPIVQKIRALPGPSATLLSVHREGADVSWFVVGLDRVGPVDRPRISGTGSATTAPERHGPDRRVDMGTQAAHRPGGSGVPPRPPMSRIRFGFQSHGCRIVHTS